MNARRKKAPSPNRWEERDKTAEIIWKWLLRGVALAAFGYVLVGLHGNVPVGTYVLIGGFGGLPNVVSLQRALNLGKQEEGP